MEIRIQRNSYESGAGYTIGRLYLQEGGYFCDTLEPEDRGLKFDMPLPQIKAKKIYGKTAIPKGRYKVQFRVSPSFKDKYYAKPYNGKFPYLMDVPGFSGVMIHPGNYAPGTPGAPKSDTSGCILVGVLHSGIRGRLYDSVLAWEDLMKFYLWPAYERKEEVWITID